MFRRVCDGIERREKSTTGGRLADSAFANLIFSLCLLLCPLLPLPLDSLAEVSLTVPDLFDTAQKKRTPPVLHPFHYFHSIRPTRLYGFGLVHAFLWFARVLEGGG